MTPDLIRHRLTDRAALIATLYGEARGEPLTGIVAVGSVIRTRAQHPRWWGNGYRGVCLAKWQFSCWWESGPNAKATYDVAEALIAGAPLGDRTVLSELAWVADGLMAEQIRDSVKSADHYLTTSLLTSDAAPKWAKGHEPLAVVASHSFFRLEV